MGWVRTTAIWEISLPSCAPGSWPPPRSTVWETFPLLGFL